MNTMDVYVHDPVVGNDFQMFTPIKNPTLEQYLSFRKKAMVEGFEIIRESTVMYYPPSAIAKIVFDENC